MAAIFIGIRKLQLAEVTSAMAFSGPIMGSNI